MWCPGEVGKFSHLPVNNPLPSPEKQTGGHGEKERQEESDENGTRDVEASF
jgi:hypothetical protein